MSVQMLNAPEPGAIRVASAASAPPAASWIGMPPAAPEPMNEPITARTALPATVSCRARSLPVVDVVAVVVVIRRSCHPRFDLDLGEFRRGAMPADEVAPAPHQVYA